MEGALLTVCLITYNQRNYIVQAIESVLSQQTSFEWELVIADDCSSDGTRDILKKYADEYSGKIHLILQEKNVGPGKNWLDLIRYPSTPYVAYLEGDDYWTDDRKLEKQVAVLESDASINACFHNALILEENGNISGTVYPPKRKDLIGIEDLGDGDYIKSCTIVYRNNRELLQPLFLEKIPAEDTSLGFCLLFKGAKAHYIDNVMAVYRLHMDGTWSAIGYRAKLKWSFRNLIIYISFFKDEVLSPRLKSQLKKTSILYLKASVKRLRFKEAILAIWQYLRN